jgi:hypothetical protein
MKTNLFLTRIGAAFLLAAWISTGTAQTSGGSGGSGTTGGSAGARTPIGAPAGVRPTVIHQPLSAGRNGAGHTLAVASERGADDGRIYELPDAFIALVPGIHLQFESTAAASFIRDEPPAGNDSFSTQQSSAGIDDKQSTDDDAPAMRGDEVHWNAGILRDSIGCRRNRRSAFLTAAIGCPGSSF